MGCGGKVWRFSRWDVFILTFQVWIDSLLSVSCPRFCSRSHLQASSYLRLIWSRFPCTISSLRPLTVEKQSFRMSVAADFMEQPGRAYWTLFCSIQSSTVSVWASVQVNLLSALKELRVAKELRRMLSKGWLIAHDSPRIGARGESRVLERVL